MVRRTEVKTKDAPTGRGKSGSATGAVSIPLSEIRFRFSRSGGAGGQHVNKVSTRVELLFDLAGSASLTADQKHTAAEALVSHMDDAGMLSLVVDTSRSQWKNRELAVERLHRILHHALRPRKKRVATRVHRQARERRLQTKKIQARKKSERRYRDGD